MGAKTLIIYAAFLISLRKCISGHGSVQTLHLNGDSNCKFVHPNGMLYYILLILIIYSLPIILKEFGGIWTPPLPSRTPRSSSLRSRRARRTAARRPSTTTARRARRVVGGRARHRRLRERRPWRRRRRIRLRFHRPLGRQHPYQRSRR